MKIPTKSQFLVQELQRKYGSANFRKWQSLRRQFYSFVAYNSTSGNAELRFFGSAISAAENRQFTNMPKANSFGQNHFMLKAVRTGWFIPDTLLGTWASTNSDRTTLFSEFTAGIFQAGVLELTIGSRLMLQIPKPFLYAPPGDGRPEVYCNGLQSITLIEGTPNVYPNTTSGGPQAVVGMPWCDLTSNRENVYLVDPNIVIEAEQNFDCVIRYPSGPLLGVATSIINDSTNPLRLGVILDGLVFRPQQ